MSDEGKSASKKLYDMLEHCMWCYPGGFLSCIALGASEDGNPLLHVHVVRKLRQDQKDKIPSEIDGVPVRVTVTGMMRLN